MSRLRTAVSLIATVLIAASLAGVVLVRAFPGASAESEGAKAPTTQAPAGAVAPRVSAATAPVAPAAVGQLAEARDCVTHVTSYDRVTPTVKQETSSASLAIVGTVSAVDAARWNTPDGAAPVASVTAATTVYRLVTFSVDSALKGSVGKSIQLRLPGGRAGCETFLPEGVPVDINVGDRLAIFVQNLPALDANGAPAPTAVDAWPVGTDGTIQTPADGTMTVSMFVSKVTSATAP